MNGFGRRWVLAFDGACSKCQEISHAVHRACDGKLEALPLTHPDVQRWRAESLGAEAPWAPTLIALEGETVRVWTGKAMALPLARWLGPRSTLRVLLALGQLQHQARSRAKSSSGGQLLFQLATGLVIATGMILKGDTPSFAESPASRARAWVQANKATLPERYDDVIQHEPEYRRAIYDTSSAEVRSRLWVDHLERYRSLHPDLSSEQSLVIDRALAIASATETFTDPLAPEAEQQLEEVGQAAVQKFGSEGAYTLLAYLGPATEIPQEPTTSQSSQGRLPDCTCSIWDPWCSGGTCVSNGTCSFVPSGCGWMWEKACQGLCF